VKITQVEVIQLVKPLASPMRNSKQALRRRSISLVRLSTDESLTGLGEAWCEPTVAEAVVLAKLAPLVLGEDPFNVERIWQRAFHAAAMYDPKGSMLAGMSGIDLACWDIIGKALGQPVCKLIGGICRDRLPAYASDLHWQEDPAAMAHLAASFAEQGFRIVKTHLGVEPEDDVRRVRALREAIGPGVGLMVDINTAFDRPTAIRFGQRIAEYDIYWYEEPISPLDIAGYSVVRASTGLQIATGENEYTRYGFKELFDKGGVDVAMPDVARAGGITELKKICALGEAYGVPISPHNYSSGICSAATLQLMAATPSTSLLEWDTVSASIGDELFVEPPEVRDGYVSVPQVPGLGVQLTDDLRSRYATERSG